MYFFSVDSVITGAVFAFLHRFCMLLLQYHSVLPTSLQVHTKLEALKKKRIDTIICVQWQPMFGNKHFLQILVEEVCFACLFLHMKYFEYILSCQYVKKVLINCVYNYFVCMQNICYALCCAHCMRILFVTIEETQIHCVLAAFDNVHFCMPFNCINVQTF